MVVGGEFTLYNYILFTSAMSYAYLFKYIIIGDTDTLRDFVLADNDALFQKN